jgi:adenylate cyclase, class 2
MSTEIEKKYRINEELRAEVVRALEEAKAEYVRRDFEENIIYSNELLRSSAAVIRLRLVGDRALLTYKRSIENHFNVKERVEHETAVADAGALKAILSELEMKPVLVYEKYRDTWMFRSVEVVLDELPFGYFMEIEGSVTGIAEAEILLGIEHLESVHETYPGLTSRLGTRVEGVIESRFAGKEEGN